jgi:Family of unknown function (DUF6272)
MSAPGSFLNYHGPVDLQVIETLLERLRKSREFEVLNTTTGKRTYSLFVECLENIYRHSALKSSGLSELQPHISIGKTDGKIIISAGNPVAEDSREKLALSIGKINMSDITELKRLREIRFRSDSSRGENGAGLGFICMAIKSGNKIKYRFDPLITGYLLFEIELSLNN